MSITTTSGETVTMYQGAGVRFQRRFVRIVGDAPEVHPLRLRASRVLASALAVRLAATAMARATAGFFLDEYFVVARNR